MTPSLPALLLAAVGLASSSRAAADEKVDFAKDVKPILQASCVKCHSFDPAHPKKKGAGEFRLDDKSLAFKGGRSGNAIVPGDARVSLFYKLLNGPVDDPAGSDEQIDAMPKPKRGQEWKPLPKEQLETLRRWINQGAAWPDAAGAPQRPQER